MRHVATVAVSLALVASAAGCGSDDTSPAAAVAPSSSTIALTTTSSTTTTTTTTTTTPPRAALRVVVLGDSVGRSFVVNLADHGSGDIAFIDGSIEGCGIFSDGIVRSSDGEYSRDLAQCAGWASRWKSSARAARADIALVIVGAWDVFDLHRTSGVVEFASPEFDFEALGNLQDAIDGLTAVGARVALLEVACGRPHDVPEFDTPPLPERGEDWRVEHLNALLREVAEANAGTTRFVEGPDAWCADAVIGADLRYRWDGVHLLAPGAALIFDAIAPALRAMR